MWEMSENEHCVACVFFFFLWDGMEKSSYLRAGSEGQSPDSAPSCAEAGGSTASPPAGGVLQAAAGATCPDALVPHVWAPFVVGQTPPDLIPSLEGCLPGHCPLRCGFYTNINLHEVGLSCFFRRKGRQSLFWSVLDSRNRSIFEVIFTMLCKKNKSRLFWFSYVLNVA